MFYLMTAKYAIFSNIEVRKIEHFALGGGGGGRRGRDTRYITVQGMVCD